MFLICVVMSVVLLASKYRFNVLWSVQNICKNITNSNIINSESNEFQRNEKKNVTTLDKIILADSLEKCDYAVQRIHSNLSDGILGFDCEWVNDGPVTLLQLATYNGVCALFRLGRIGYVPQKLQELLANSCILKVGVAPYEDGKKLTNDYGCTVVGTVDLRTLAEHLSTPSRKSLAALCIQYLGVEMDKILEVRCGDWNADTLTKEQIEYAAYDAIASVLIYHQIRNASNKRRSMWSAIAMFIKKKWGRTNGAVIHNLPDGIIDTRYREPSDRQIAIYNDNNNNNKNSNNNNIVNESHSKAKDFKNIKTSSLPTRKEPLYHNCYLQAPDGEALCTCDRKKAEWYINKNLGTKVKDEPFTVQLNFEPSGRAHGEVGQYYTQVKVNQCVVCGAQDKFIKKNIVPREYRKYLPLVMKSHQSHDVLLLCPTCHVKSNKYDLQLRRELAALCGTPISQPVLPIKSAHYQRRKKFMSTMKTLEIRNALLPLHRKHELESHILEYTQQYHTYPHVLDFRQDDESTNESIISTCEQIGYVSHGQQVVQYFTECEGGLTVLEQMWREHFLKTMRPQFLPQLWSVQHNQERLKIGVNQKRLEPEDARIAGVQ